MSGKDEKERWIILVDMENYMLFAPKEKSDLRRNFRDRYINFLTIVHSK